MDTRKVCNCSRARAWFFAGPCPAASPWKRRTMRPSPLTMLPREAYRYRRASVRDKRLHRLKLCTAPPLSQRPTQTSAWQPLEPLLLASASVCLGMFVLTCHLRTVCCSFGQSWAQRGTCHWPWPTAPTLQHSDGLSQGGAPHWRLRCCTSVATMHGREA